MKTPFTTLHSGSLAFNGGAFLVLDDCAQSAGQGGQKHGAPVGAAQQKGEATETPASATPHCRGAGGGGGAQFWAWVWGFSH